jgi:thymidylate kinase
LNEEIIIIDGSKSKEEVFENILKVLDSKNLV